MSLRPTRIRPDGSAAGGSFGGDSRSRIQLTEPRAGANATHADLAVGCHRRGRDGRNCFRCDGDLSFCFTNLS
jgi:hypothetical protein